MPIKIKAPKWLTRREKRIFKQIPVFCEIDIFSAALLAVYVDKSNRFHANFNESTLAGKLSIVQEMGRTTDKIISLANQFGMTPKSREIK